MSVPRQDGELLLVSFQDEPDPYAGAAPGAAETSGAGEAMVQQLERELQATRDDLQSTIEEMESSNEELKAANEEVMSVNEELQSTNEELETSKEELQSLNEELSTVNSQLEEKLRELEAVNDDLDNLMNSTDIATLFLDRELRIKRFTPATNHLFNLITTDRGRPVSDIARKFEDPELLTDARRVLEQLVPIEKDVAIDAGEHWYTRRILPYRTQDDRIQGVVITFVDVTERKHALQWFRLIVEAAPNAVVVVNMEGRIELINAETEQSFGYEREELLGKPVEVLVPERFRGQHPAQRQAYLAKPEPRSMGDGRELFGRRKDGSEFPVEIGLNPLVTDWGAFVLATIVDITERQQTAQELRNAKTQAERANHAKTLFLASASHDLRQPLQTLSLLNGVLASKSGDAGVREIASKQEAALLSMKQLLRVFLDLSRLDAGTLKPEISDFPVNEVLTVLENEFAAQTNTRGIRLRIRPCSPRIRSDPSLLRRILENFLSNALRYTDAGRVLVGCRRRGARLRIEVWDTGAGIPADQLDAIFEEFVQLDNPARQERKGYGVGLSIAKSLAQLLEHSLDVHSTPGKGSMFAVEVPVTHAPASTRHAERAAAVSVPYEGKPAARVLVVEDDPGVLAATRELLESLGLTVTAVRGGREALALIECAERPELIIADFRLENGASGIEVIERLRDSLGGHLPALLISGDTLPESGRTMAASGLRVLQKPIETDQLVTALNALHKA